MGEVDAAATAIGITPVQLAQELKGGKSIADVATAHNVAVDKVVTAMVTAANKRIDDAVTAGKIDATKGRRDEDAHQGHGHEAGQRKTQVSVTRSWLKRSAEMLNWLTVQVSAFRIQLPDVRGGLRGALQ